MGNNGGLLEFDGASWRKITIPNASVRSLALDGTGTIYVGGSYEIGFIVPDSKGFLQYRSLVEHLADNRRNFGNVVRTHATKEGIYFRTTKYLFRWNSAASKPLKVWEPLHRFGTSFLCSGKLFIYQEHVGLMLMENESLKLVPGGEKFAGVKIYMMVPYDSQKLLIGTEKNGFYLYDGFKAVRFPTDADDYLKEKELSAGIRLESPPGDFALGTRYGGLVIMDSAGHLKRIFNKDSGLQNDNIKYLFEDYHGSLWLALEKGISKIEYASPISFFNYDQSNLPGLVLSVVKHHGDLYAGTTWGLFSLVKGNSKPEAIASPGRFRRIPGISMYCWSLLSIDDSVLAATSDGVFQVKNNKKKMVIENHSYVLLRSKKDTNRVWVGTRQQGLVSLYRENGQWKKTFKSGKISLAIRTIVEDKKGNLWLGTFPRGVLKVDFPIDGSANHHVVTEYDRSSGLPTGELFTFMASKHVMFASPTAITTGMAGIFRFDEVNKRFIPDLTLGDEFVDGSTGVFRIMEDENENIWIISNNRTIQAIPQQDGTYDLKRKAYLRIPRSQVNAIYPDPDGKTIWFATQDGLVCYDTMAKNNYRRNFSTYVREMEVNGTHLFYDSENDKYKTGKNRPQLPPVIDYKDRFLRFEFAAPCFEDQSRTRYRCLLEGYDKDWSNWKEENQATYADIDSGTYTFRVTARNVYEDQGGEAVFQFKILPPWYRTWWAFLSYAFAVFLLTFLVVKWWRSWKLEQEKQRLEQIVHQRAKEILEKNHQLEEQAEKLKEMDHVKSRFFANISHEFRTPLTLIMGPLEQMLSDSNDQKQHKKLHLMLRNSQRLLGLINQLLELSKFESGKVKLQASPQNIVPFIKGVVASFELLATQRDLDLAFHAEDEEMVVSMDLGKMEEVLCNILINAIKFTPAGGRVTVTVKANPEKETGFPPGSVVISISDTGPGIPPDQLAHIFDRFYQSDATYEHHRKGSGIGLAIAKELVELHHGTIEANSTEGEGTEFNIHLPPGVPVDDKGVPAEPVVPADYKVGLPADVRAEMDNGGDESVIDAIELDAEPGASDKDIILVVEDNADVRDYIRGSIEDDYAVVEAKDGEEGINKALDIIPDLIISDIMMPKADGYELCRRLKNDIKTSHVPIVLLTAKASEENIVAGLETGADDYVTKPFSTKILCARIKNLIDLRRQLQQNLNREMTMRPVKTAVSEIDREFLEDLKAVLHKNMADPDFNVEELSKKLYMSRATLYRKVHALSGESPTEFLRSYRLKRGAELLKRNHGSVLEVAFEVGFSSAAYFTKCFKDKFHQLPSSFQATEADH